MKISKYYCITVVVLVAVLGQWDLMTSSRVYCSRTMTKTRAYCPCV